MTPELAPPLEASEPHQRENFYLPTYDLTCNSPNTRRIFSQIGFRTWNSPARKPIPNQHKCWHWHRPCE
ncbi:hypothetical protein AVEN_160896-1, partial [Araneus ventricosus]